MIELVRAGRSPEELAKEFEPSAQAIRNWVAQADRDEGRRSDGLTHAERSALARLRKENKQLRLEREILSKAAAWFARETKAVPSRGSDFVSAHRAVYPIAAMCRVLGISSSGYYAWAKRTPSARAISDAALIERIGAIDAASHGSYGSPRVQAELAESGLRVSRKRIAWLMKAASLAGVSRRRFVTMTVRHGGRQAPICSSEPSRLKRPIGFGLPISPIFNLVRLSLPRHRSRCVQPEDRRLVDVFDASCRCWSAALNMALAVRKPKGVIHHSDQGSQYTSIAFGNRCREAGVRPSMGSVGDAYDNAMAESFFATLECELLDRRRFQTQAEARMAVFAFIEGFYNPRRRHWCLDICRGGVRAPARDHGAEEFTILARPTQSCRRARPYQAQALAGAQSARA